LARSRPPKLFCNFGEADPPFCFVIQRVKLGK
jgi:hypothetical protein